MNRHVYVQTLQIKKGNNTRKITIQFAQLTKQSESTKEEEEKKEA
jgi:hypothetical protein